MPVKLSYMEIFALNCFIAVWIGSMIHGDPIGVLLGAAGIIVTLWGADDAL